MSYRVGAGADVSREGGAKRVKLNTQIRTKGAGVRTRVLS